MEGRASLRLSLILVVQPGQVGTDVSCDTLVPRHHKDDPLPVRSAGSEKTQLITCQSIGKVFCFGQVQRGLDRVSE